MTFLLPRTLSRKRQRVTVSNTKRRPRINADEYRLICFHPRSSVAYGFLLGVDVAGILTEGGRGVFEPSLRARRPVLVSAIRFSESEEGWSTVTLIARNVPSGVLLVGL